MALNVREYRHLAEDDNGRLIAAPLEPAAYVQSISVGSESSAFGAGVRFLRLHAEEDVRLEFGDSPSATSTSTFRMVAGQTEFVGVKPGQKLDTIAG